MEAKRKKPVSLFWTGGWDSTYRLMELLLLEKQAVQPFYLVDENRQSTEIEIKTMERISRMLIEKYPETAGLLLPVKFFPAHRVRIDREIGRAWRQIRNTRHIGEQYKWLASFCKENDLYDMELSIQKRDTEEKIESSLAHILSREDVPENDRTLFKYFSYPLINLSKKEMLEIARKQNWMPLLNKTWFCHHPLHIPFHGTVPCGGCNPCIVAIEEGFGNRILFINRILGKFAKKVYHIFKF